MAVEGNGGAYQEMLHRIGENLRSLGCHGRVAFLSRPDRRPDPKAVHLGQQHRRLLEQWEKCREAILKDASAETKGVHQARCKGRRVACVAEA